MRPPGGRKTGSERPQHGFKRHVFKRHGVKRHGVKRHGVKRQFLVAPSSFE
jgi:hypothetical protein